MPEFNALKEKYATPRLAAGETSLAHDVTAARTHFDIKLTPSSTGTMSGSVHMPGPVVAQLLGQTTVDLAHLDKVQFHSASSNVAAPVGLHFEMGQGATASTFQTIDRVSHVTNNGGVTACHAVIGPSSGCGAVTTYSNLGEIETSFGKNQASLDNTAHALGRSLRWAGTPVSQNLAGTCTQVGTGTQSRWLVPSDEQKCAMSKLFHTNADCADFCNQRYASKGATMATDREGRSCKVVTSADFENVQSALLSRFAEKDALKHGLTLYAESFDTSDHMLHTELATSGFKPAVSVDASFVRKTTSDFLATPPQAAKALGRSHFHELLHEDADHSHNIDLHDPATTADSFAELILGLKLDSVTAAETPAASIMPGSATITAGVQQPSDA